MHALCQAFLTARVEKSVGAKGAILVGIASDAAGLILFSFARSTTFAFSVMPLFCLGGIAQPALQSLLSGRTSEDRQGELQGVLTSFNSLVAIASPLAAGSLYELLRIRLPQYPGSIWLIASFLYAPTLVILLRTSQLQPPRPARPDNSTAIP
jgi:DHA1 family tetracycline resistance protein-like MFS transporter